MRKVKQRLKQNHHDICSWVPHQKTDTERMQQDNFMSFAIHHSNPASHKVTHSLDNHNFIRTSTTHKLSRPHKEQLNLHEKSLSLMKDYYNKHYTQQTIETKQIMNKSCTNEFNSTSKSYKKLQQRVGSFKKTNIVDLTRTLEDSISKQKKRLHTEKQYPGSRVLRIKQEMIRYKQRRKIQHKVLEISDELAPQSKGLLIKQSKTLPVRCLVKHFGSNKKPTYPVFPDKHFAQKLSQFLEKA